MRVCLLNVLHEAHDKRVYHKIALSLASAGHELVSICPDSTHAPGSTEGPDAHGIRFRFIPKETTLWGRFKSVFRLIAQGRKEVKADVYFAPEPESWVAALVLKYLRGGKVIFDMHEHVPSEFSKFFPAFTRSFVEWITVLKMRLYARRTDLIILTRESFETPWRGLATPRITIINTNHLQPRCVDIPNELRHRFGKRPVILHQGIFGDVRGSWQLLEAMKLLAAEFPGILCVILGEYLYGNLDEYKSAVNRVGLADNILFLPPVPFAEVPAHIALSKVGLILFQPGPLNHTLAMPHKLFDYMREAVPVVAPDFALEVSRIVREADCGLLVDVTSPEAIAGAVACLLREPGDAARLGENGRRIIEEKYHWQHEEKVLLDAFSRLEQD